ncbi:MAG: hypothetical protein WC313_07365 [Candidatus Kapaibacterium sp.]
MIKQVHLLMILFFSLAFIISCENEKSDELIESSDTLVSEQISIHNDTSLTQKEAEYLQSLEKKEEVKERYQQIIKEKNLTKEQLLEFLPASINGFQSLPHTTGKSYENDSAVTISVRRQFKNDKRQTLVFDLFDYGNGNPIPHKLRFEVLPTDLDGVTFPIEMDGSKGYYYWVDNKNYGHIEVIAADRFVIIIRINGFEPDNDLIENFLKQVNIKSLVQIGNQ